MRQAGHDARLRQMRAGRAAARNAYNTRVLGSWVVQGKQTMSHPAAAATNVHESTHLLAQALHQRAGHVQCLRQAAL